VQTLILRNDVPGTRPWASNQDPLTADRGWDVLQVLLAVFILTAIGRLHQLYPQIQPIKPAMLSAVGAIVYFAADTSRLRRLRTVNFPTTWFVVAILLWIAIGLPTSIHQRHTWELLTGDFSKTVVMFVVIVAATRSLRDVERLLLAYLASSVIYAFVVVTRFSVGPGSWRLTNLYSYDPNDFATWAVSAIPIALHFLTSRGKSAYRLLAIVGLPLLIFAFVKSGSRGGFVALGVTVLYLLVFGRAIAFRWKAVGIAVIALTMTFTASEQFWTQMRTIVSPTEDYNMTSETGRVEIWKRGVGYLLTHPVLGVGGANFGVAEGTLSPLAWRQQYGLGVKWTAPHNSFIQIAVDLGFPGIFFLLGSIVATFILLRRVRQGEDRHPRALRLSEPLTASFLGFIVGAFFLSFAYSSILYVLIAFATATAKVWSVSGHRAPGPLGPSRPHQSGRAPRSAGPLLQR
jgi:O-antigen ligase